MGFSCTVQVFKALEAQTLSENHGGQIPPFPSKESSDASVGRCPPGEWDESVPWRRPHSRALGMILGSKETWNTGNYNTNEEKEEEKRKGGSKERMKEEVKEKGRKKREK